MPADEGGPPERPDYKVYRSRPGLLSRFRKPELGSLRDKMPRRSREKPKTTPKAPGETSTARKVLKWVGIAALAWLAISILAFMVSAQIQKGKLADGISA